MNPIYILISDIIKRLWPDKSEEELKKLEIELQAAVAENNISIEQIKTNRQEAQHKKLFVAGWRPFVGWVCALAFGWEFLGKPVLLFLIIVSGHAVPELPKLDVVTLTGMLGGLLGFGYYRTKEKLNNIGHD